MVHLLDKDFKTVVLKMLRELKENIRKSTRCVNKNGNINKEKTEKESE